MSDIPLIGYSDLLSGRPGDTLSFKVSSRSTEDYQARLVRVISADPNPQGPGIIEQEVDAHFAGSYPSRVQPFYPGSYARVESAPAISGNGSFALTARIWPTLPGQGQQTIIACGKVQLSIDRNGALSATVDGVSLSITGKLATRKWCEVQLGYDAAGGRLLLSHIELGGETVSATETIGEASLGAGPVTIAAALRAGLAVDHFNGKIESPALYAAAAADQSKLAARWDFSREISSSGIVDVGPQQLHGKLINLPARAMTGSNWDGSEMSWRHAPEQYGAIHFHDDDIYDFGWETDFSFTIPDALPSGVYAVRIRCGDHQDAISFFVCPPLGKRSADLCVLVSTFTYAVYGNHARPDFSPHWKQRFAAWNAYPWNPAEHREYGLSTYNFHNDGSGICHASHRRPLFNLRPGYVTFGYGPGSGHRHFQADSHLLAWLNAKDIAYDVITDRELHEQGMAAIDGYRAVTTGSHPEYHSRETLNALQSYRDNGGKLLYLGGNGFYWRVAVHQEHADAIEIRRGEGGIRAWAAEPGEYYNAFDGAYGGLWRRNGRPPQRLAGIGFSAQGQFEGSYYRRTKASYESSVAWIFTGIDDELIGDFGLSGGGAAGFELDRADTRLGTPANVIVLASSENHGESFVLVPEEQLTHITTWSGEPVQDLLRADMVYFELPGGGKVFATGSITFCGSLPHNDFDNNVSRLLENVVRQFLAS